MKNKHQNLKILIVSLSLILLLMSLTQNAYYIAEMKDSIGSFGLTSFLLGWFDIFGPGISWLANPLLIISWIVLIFKNSKISLYLSFMAVVFSLSFLFFKEIIVNEAGEKSEIIVYGNGYWLWLSSCVLNFFGNIIVCYKLKKIH
ncbi:hypothetical protein FLACOL_01838 [Flavobacterium columnare]|uniref:Uncharacterized protein n=2 Tax=Flavobacterium TaxID=237 RepID=A0ABW8PMA5_9FLAO|nr:MULTISPECIES: hypothetical protein [Flavobacterium]QYS89112.1 hypothetical protein JJC05_01360 [Flavobacterium davisii]SPE77828.1 hypothetical protein FLACOL_01838 [Flavobacterium columnare]